MANYTSKFTGTEIDALLDLVANGKTVPESITNIINVLYKPEYNDDFNNDFLI